MIAKKCVAAILSTLVILEILSVTTMDSLNPWAVLHHEATLLKVLGWLLAVQGAMATAVLLILPTLSGKTCPICEKNLTLYMEIFGGLTICHKCHTMFHKNCFKAKKTCPNCHPTSGDAQVDLDFTQRYFDDHLR